MFQTKVIDKIKTRILLSVTFSPKIMPFMRYCGKIRYSPTGHRWQYNTAHALGMVDNQGYRHTLGICNTFCFSSAKRHDVSVYTYIACLNLWYRQHCSTFIFRSKESDLLTLKMKVLRSSLKSRELCRPTLRQSETTRKNWSFSNSTVRTPNLAPNPPVTEVPNFLVLGLGSIKPTNEHDPSHPIHLTGVSRLS
jgi:hypothetical protein